MRMELTDLVYLRDKNLVEKYSGRTRMTHEDELEGFSTSKAQEAKKVLNKILMVEKDETKF